MCPIQILRMLVLDSLERASNKHILGSMPIFAMSSATSLTIVFHTEFRTGKTLFYFHMPLFHNAFILVPF